MSHAHIGRPVRRRLAFAAVALAAIAAVLGGDTARAAGNVLLVTTTADDVATPPAGSLREAVEKLAQAGDTIRFDGSIEVQLQGNLVIRRALTGLRIEGLAGIRAIAPKSPKVPKVIGDQIGRVVVLADDVTLDKINFVNHFVDAAITYDRQAQIPVSRCKVTNCTFSGNGGVNFDSVTDGEVSDCTFDVRNLRAFSAVIDLDRTTDCRVLRNTIAALPDASDFALADVEGTNDLFDANTVQSNVFLQMRSGEIRNTTMPKAQLYVMTPTEGTVGSVDVFKNEVAKLTVARADVDVEQNIVKEPQDGSGTPDTPKLKVRGKFSTLLRVAPPRGSQAPVNLYFNVVTGGDYGIGVFDPRTGATMDAQYNEVRGSRKEGVHIESDADVVFAYGDIREIGSAGGGNAVGLAVREGAGNVVLAGNDTYLVNGVGVLIDGKGPAVSVGSSDAFVCERMGFLIGARRTVTLSGVTAENCQEDGVVCARGSRVKISGGKFRGNGMSGVYVDAGALAEVHGVTMTGNGALGIDVAPRGVTPNRKKPKPGRTVPWPELLVLDDTTKRVTGRSVAGATVDVYEVEEGAREGNPKNGEGVKHLGSAQADAAGLFSWQMTGDCPKSGRLTFTTTIPDGDTGATSEFSEDLECPVQPPMQLVSQSSAEVAGDDDCTTVPWLGTASAPIGHGAVAGGRYVVFTSKASNLTADPHVAGSTNVFLRDLVAGTTVLVTKTYDGMPFEAGFATVPVNKRAGDTASISDDGRYVAFVARSSRIVPNDFDSQPTVVLYDVAAGTNTHVTDPTLHTMPLLPSGAAAKGGGDWCSISGDGGAVAFMSIGRDWDTPAENSADEDFFVWDRVSDAVERVSTTDAGAQVPNITAGVPVTPRLSFDGRYCAFASTQNLGAGGTAGGLKLWIRDRQLRTTELVSVDEHGNAKTGNSPVISDDGRYVAFVSKDALVDDDTNLIEDVYLRDRTARTTSRLSERPDGVEFPREDSHVWGATMTGDARFVAFSNIGVHTTAAGVITRAPDTFLLDRTYGVVVELTGPAGELNGSAFGAALARDGTSIVFCSNATNLVAEVATGDVDQVYVKPLDPTAVPKK